MGIGEGVDRLAQVARVHVDADAAAVDLAGAQMHQFKQFFREAVLGQFTQRLQRLHVDLAIRIAWERGHRHEDLGHHVIRKLVRQEIAQLVHQLASDTGGGRLHRHRL